MKIGFVGLSHLGLCYLVAAAVKKIKVYGFDKDIKRIHNLKMNNFEIEEKKLKHLHRLSAHNIEYFSNFENLNECDLIFLSEDVKTDSKGISDLSKVKDYIKLIQNKANKKSELVILSQVHPGFTRNINWSKKKLFYQVETLVIGNAIERALYPERIILGSVDAKLNKKSHFYKYLYKFKSPILKMNYETAELSKISINMFLISSVSTANAIATICEKIGGDWKRIVDSLRLDKRIGKYSYIETGLGLAGGNLERDLLSIIKLSEQKKINSNIFKAFLENSKIHRNWVLNIIKKKKLIKKKYDKITILGLTYKEGTNSIKNSNSIELIKKLSLKNIHCYDPKADLTNIKIKIKRSPNIKDAIQDATILIIMTKWDEFKKIKLTNIKKQMKGNIIIDPYGLLEAKNPKKLKFEYYSKGKN